MSITRRILLKKEYNNYTNENFTHLIIENNNIDSIKEFYILKKRNRYIKIIYELDIFKYTDINIKNIIKLLINYCVDGIIFKNIKYDNIVFIHNIIDIIEKLPSPYDFKWEFFIKTNDIDIILDLFRLFKSNNNENAISGIITNYEYIKLLTDNGFKSSLFIIDDDSKQIITELQENKENINLSENYKKINKMGIIYVIKMNKLGGIYTKKLYDLGKELINSSNVEENHIEYPTSDIVKIIEIDDIISLYMYN